MFHRTALCLALCLAVAALAAFAEPARAQGAIYAWTNDSYWKVGRLDKELSALCRRNAFNQVRKNRLKIWYTGKDNVGRGITGVAKYGWNLHDPKGRAVPDVTYHFINDGYSNCTVFVGTLTGACRGSAAPRRHRAPPLRLPLPGVVAFPNPQSQVGEPFTSRATTVLRPPEPSERVQRNVAPHLLQSCSPGPRAVASVLRSRTFFTAATAA